MKKEIHPDDYRLVVFKDMSNDYAFLCPSCAPTKETIKWEDGNDYQEGDRQDMINSFHGASSVNLISVRAFNEK